VTRSQPHSENDCQPSINWGSSISGDAYWVTKALHGYLSLLLHYWPPPRSKIKHIKGKTWIQILSISQPAKHANVIPGCQIIDSHWELLSNSKGKHIICIYRWTHWTTHWLPAQFRRVWSFLLNCTRMDGSGWSTTRTANSVLVGFRPVPAPEATVLNRC